MVPGLIQFLAEYVETVLRCPCETYTSLVRFDHQQRRITIILGRDRAEVYSDEGVSYPFYYHEPDFPLNLLTAICETKIRWRHLPQLLHKAPPWLRPTS